MGKQKESAELIIVYEKLALQRELNDKYATELLIARRELAFLNEEKEKREAQLILANKELLVQNEEKEKRAAELSAAISELKKAEKYEEDYIKGLEEMIFMTSHNVRQPITNILGIVDKLEHSEHNPDEFNRLILYIRQSASWLDTFTKALTLLMVDLEKKGKVEYKQP